MLTNPGKHTSLYEIAELFGEAYNTVARLKKINDWFPMHWNLAI